MKKQVYHEGYNYVLEYDNNCNRAIDTAVYAA